MSEVDLLRQSNHAYHSCFSPNLIGGCYDFLPGSEVQYTGWPQCLVTPLHKHPVRANEPDSILDQGFTLLEARQVCLTRSMARSHLERLVHVVRNEIIIGLANLMVLTPLDSSDARGPHV